MNINLNTITLELIWVNFKRDKTNRSVTLQQIANMDKDQRKQLHFISDFKDETITMINHKENMQVEIFSFEKLADNVGFIYFSNTDKTGLFYEAIFVTENLKQFNDIKKTYYSYINK